MQMNQCDKCGKVFEPDNKSPTNTSVVVWEERFTLTVRVDGYVTSGNVHLCTGCIKLAVADWRPS